MKWEQLGPARQGHGNNHHIVEIWLTDGERRTILTINTRKLNSLCDIAHENTSGKSVLRSGAFIFIKI